MLQAGVHPDVIALQMTKNSPNKIKYTTNDVQACEKIYQDSKSKVVITSEQARSLIKDQNNETPAKDKILI
ncbi:hypothetical protein [Photorhabdus heterorhabditis]|uniref:hypothetical protein n=1 Tax=Photorhabdus heterorhabditis TaxID=880156 RepID=UPI001BD5B66D|nr:hypothetical protein [Photorhabdus heterorhabditis]MBS9443012.1 hypothetical protein [Photorhabdus heterorhabditis]